MLNEYPENDNQFQEHFLIKIKEEKESYSFKFDDDWSFGIDKKTGIVPKIGDLTRSYGKGIGYVVRGFFINGKKVYYRTEQEEEQRHKEWCNEERKKKEENFIKEKDDRDRRIERLPLSMMKRLDGFFCRNKDFRVEYEPYELFCLEQAVLIAKTLKSEKEINDFKKLSFKKQKELIPEISDQHSGNTFGFSCLMAKFLLQKADDDIIKWHGAMCPLVGCQEYGCWATIQK